MNDTNRKAPGAQEIKAIADIVLAGLPERMRAHIMHVPVRVVDFPDEDICREMALESPFDLLGLYQGVALCDKSVSDVVHDVDIIFLFRRPILDYCAETGENLEIVVRHVLIHEIGHHFGFSDSDMLRIEEEA